MKQIRDILKDQKIEKYIKKGKVTIIKTKAENYIVKENKVNDKIYTYLKSRNFENMPKIIKMGDGLRVTNYIEDYEIPEEQKILDLIELVALLHNKTTHYKQTDGEYYQQVYEDLDGNLEYLYSYYTDLITYIETKVYMSPSEYYLARNISLIYNSISNIKQRLDKWYEVVKIHKKRRVVVVHNNLKLDHFIRNDNSYLINWDKSKIESPVFDLYILYKNHALDFDFISILNHYEKSYPLQEHEKELLLILISIPDIIELNKKEIDNCKEITKTIEKLKITLPYYSENAKSEEQKENKE